jgi:thiol-disulfide isomerase/thioredoxin
VREATSCGDAVTPLELAPIFRRLTQGALARMVRPAMADEALRARGSDVWIWALVAAATASVVALAVIQGNRAGSALAPPRRAPSLALPLLDGGKAALPQGKVTLVDFWATWCAPCRVSMPRIQKLWMEYRARGVELYSVDTDEPSADREAQVRAFLQQNGLKFPVVIDDGAASEAFSIARLPTMLLLDKAGSVVWSHVGALTESRERGLRAAIDRALDL